MGSIQDQTHLAPNFSAMRILSVLMVLLSTLFASAQSVVEMRKLAARGNGNAQFALGMIYYGEGCDRSGCTSAIQWFELAALQEHRDAQNMLGSIYLSGDGVQINYQEALKWYRMAAKAGHAEAQFNLGWMYYYGRGVTKNNDLVAMWMKKAADGGNRKAKEFIEANRLERFL